MDSSLVRKYVIFFPVLLHIVLILGITVWTINSLNSAIVPAYITFSILFLVSTVFSLVNMTRFRAGVFYYLLNLMFLLGFWFKYSVKTLTGSALREAVGSFTFTPESEVRILWVVIWGIFGFFVAQLLSYFIYKRKRLAQNVTESLNYKPALYILLLSIALSFLNLKFNVLLFGFKSDLVLPFKGNAIFFLLLTKGTLFLFFYYCLKDYSKRMIVIGAILATICSVGVLSRMVIFIYFSAIFIFLLQQFYYWDLKKIIQNIAFCTVAFFAFSYITVFLSSGLRDVYSAKNTPPPVQQVEIAASSAPLENHNDKASVLPSISSPIVDSFNIEKQFKNYLELAVGRWIGIEGVMAVDSYKGKSFSFLWEALSEKSYHGNSFYTRISNPEIPIDRDLNKTISTSVPGPVAFFYYTGNILFVFAAMFLSTFFLSLCENVAIKFFKNNQSVVVLISSFLVGDFFQFGISPLAYLRYLSFSLLCVAFFYYVVEHNKKTSIK